MKVFALLQQFLALSYGERFGWMFGWMFFLVTGLVVKGRYYWWGGGGCDLSLAVMSGVIQCRMDMISSENSLLKQGMKRIHSYNSL